MKRILLIEDEKDMVTAVKFRLEGAGYEVSVAMDGEDGLNKSKNEKPDLILLDLMLPRINGYKICRILKSDPKYSGIPIIIFTARAQESERALGKEAGADAYITKPFDAPVLLGKIKELLKQE